MSPVSRAVLETAHLPSQRRKGSGSGSDRPRAPILGLPFAVELWASYLNFKIWGPHPNIRTLTPHRRVLGIKENLRYEPGPQEVLQDGVMSSGPVVTTSLSYSWSTECTSNQGPREGPSSSGAVCS